MTSQCKPRIEIHVSRFLERCIYADSDNPYQFKGSDSCVLAQMYLPLSNSGYSSSAPPANRLILTLIRPIPLRIMESVSSIDNQKKIREAENEA